MRRFARPVFAFFFSSASTLGVCPLTLPARAREPWTLPPRRPGVVVKVAKGTLPGCQHTQPLGCFMRSNIFLKVEKV